MKVLYMTPSYPTMDFSVGGVAIREHARATRIYDDVVVLHYAGTNSRQRGLWQIEEETDDSLTGGIPTFRLWLRPLPVPKTTYFLYLLYLWSMLQTYRHIINAGFRPDIIHAHIYTSAIAAVLIAKLHHTPVVIAEHYSTFPRRLLSPTQIFRTRLAFAAAERVLPVSYALQKSIESYGIRANYQVIPNTVDIDLFYPRHRPIDPQGQKRLLFVGLLVPVKGIKYLLQALERLRQIRDDWHLDIVGDGPERDEGKRLVIELALADKVTFHGLKTKAEVAEFMREADIFVLPSLTDNCPCVLIEAMASGLPIVSTLTGGIPEIVVDEAIGFLVAPGDAMELAKALNKMIESVAEFDREAIACRARKYRLEEIGGLLHSTYTSHLRR